MTDPKRERENKRQNQEREEAYRASTINSLLVKSLLALVVLGVIWFVVFNYTGKEPAQELPAQEQT